VLAHFSSASEGGEPCYAARAVASAPDPSGRVAAFFDVDHTLLEVNSGRKWVEHLWKLKKISVQDALKSVWWLAQYRLSLLDYEAVTEEVVRGYRGQSVSELLDEVGGWFEAEIRPWICAESFERVQWHRSRGHVTVMLTSGPEFSTAPLQELLEIDHLLCTEIEVEEGVLTGRYFPPACYGEGKLRAAQALAAREDVDLQRSYFYTDSYSDLPTLERVGHPRVVNPDPRLRRHAQSTGWGWETWTARRGS
jgi:HAD superfamily hydrolase (TIGR01490 family)